MIKEHDLVVLKFDEDNYGLKAGDISTVVHCYENGSAFEVEFVTSAGETLAVLTLTSKEIRARSKREILHVRPLPPVTAPS